MGFYKVKLHREVTKFIGNLPKETKKKIDLSIEKIAASPFKDPNIIKLTGKENQYRFRAGNYRIVYQAILNDENIYILKIATRENSYKD